MSGALASARSAPQKLPVNHFDPNLPRDWRRQGRAHLYRCHCPACGPDGRGLFVPVRPGRFRLHRATANLDWFVEHRRRWTNDSMWLAAQIEPTFDIDPLDTDEDRARWRAWTMKALHPARRLTVDEWLAGCAWAHGQLEWSRKVTA